MRKQGTASQYVTHGAHQAEAQPGARRNYPQPYGDPHNFARSTQGKFVLPKKYSLTKPEKKDINVRLGPPDFFPLDATAPEDSLKQKSIVEGLIEPRIVNDEFGSLRKYFGGNLVNVNNIKTQLLQSVHEVEWKRSISPKEKERVKRTTTVSFPEQAVTSSQFRESWIEKLTGTEPLHRLAMLVPHGFKGDPLLKVLIDGNIPILRATWFIKIIYLNMKQNRQKNPIDPTGDWTITLVRFLVQLIKDSHQSKNLSDGERYVRPNYILKLVKWSYCEGLLDKDKFLTFVMEQLSEATRTEDLHILLRVLLQYMEDIAFSSAHSRRLLGHINTRLGRVNFRQLSHKSELEGIIKIVGQFLTKEVSIFKPCNQGNHEIAPLNLPLTIEALDLSLDVADLDIVYSSTFPENIAKMSLQDIFARIRLVCEWATTDSRDSEFSQYIAVSILNKCAHQFITSSPHLKLPLQGVLTEFLEGSYHSAKLWLLYGELLRYGLFSHDGYVRHLISRGRLEDDSFSYHIVLKQLPILEFDVTQSKRAIAVHERNQRRAMLNGLPTENIAYDQNLQTCFDWVTDHLLSGATLQANIAPLQVLTLHDKWVISEWLIISVMHALSHCVEYAPHPNAPELLIPACTVDMIRFVFYVLRAVNDYRGLTSLICWLLQHNNEDSIVLFAIATARNIIHAFVAQGILPELLQALNTRASTKVRVCAQTLFLEVLNTYHKIPSVQKFDVVRHKPVISAVPIAISAHKAMKELDLLNSHLSMEQIINLADAIHALDNSLRMPTIFTTVLRSCDKLQSVELRALLTLFGIVIEHAYSRIGSKELVQDIRNVLVTLPPSTDRGIVAGLLVVLSVQQIIPPTILISNVLVPLLQENITKLSLSGVLAHTELLVFLICALLGHNCTSVVNEDERRIFFHAIKPSALSAVLGPVIQLYSRLQAHNLQSPEGTALQEVICQNISSIFHESNFMSTCLTDAAYVYRQLQPLGISVRRNIFHMLCKGTLLQSQDRISMLGTSVSTSAPALVVQILDEAVEHHWVVQYCWLQLQLVLDEWTVVEPNTAPQSFVSLLLSHVTTNWTFCSIHNKLVDLLGPKMQHHLVRASMRVLESQFSSDSIASSMVELSNHLQFHGSASTLEEDGLCGAFSSLMLTGLKGISPTAREEYTTSIEQQLRRLTTVAAHIETITSPPHVLHAVQCGVWLRLKLLGALYPLTRTPELASTLVCLMSKTFIVVDESESLELVALLLSTTNSLIEEADDTSRRLLTRMKETYTAIRHMIPATHRITVEGILGNFAQPPSQTDLNSWALLEDYPDGPLSPSQIGGTRLNKRAPTYANHVFERTETPTKRLRIV